MLPGLEIRVIVAQLPVSWLGEKEAPASLRTAEAARVTLSQAAQECTWLKKLLTDLQMGDSPAVNLEDSRGAITNKECKWEEVKYC